MRCSLMKLVVEACGGVVVWAVWVLMAVWAFLWLVCLRVAVQSSWRFYTGVLVGVSIAGALV